jgi:hypothetical protein
LNFEAEAEGMTTDDVCKEIVAATPETTKDLEGALK